MIMGWYFIDYNSLAAQILYVRANMSELMEASDTCKSDAMFDSSLSHLIDFVIFVLKHQKFPS
jgi:hypothetical protein